MTEMAGRPKRRARIAAQEAEARGEAPPEPAVVNPRKKSKRPNSEQTWEEWDKQRGVNAQRVDAIIEIMSAGRWLPGVTNLRLAKEWGCTPDAVHHRAQEAGRVMRAVCRQSDEFKEDVRAEVLSTFRAIRAMALAKASPASAQNPAGCLQVGLAATRLLGFYAGVEPARKTEDVTPQDDPFHGWTAEQLEDYANHGRLPRKAIVALSSGDLGIIHQTPVDTEGVTVGEHHANGHANGSNGRGQSSVH